MNSGEDIVDKIVLVADDNAEIFEILAAYFKKEGLKPISACDGEEALVKFRQYRPAIILLDIMMPKKDGLQVCREIRKESDIPIIMLTAKNEDMDIIMGLDTGADDYVVKPFSPGTVMARVRAVLRRIDVTDEQKKKILRFPGLEISLADYQVKVNDSALNLTKKEIEILWLLAKNPGRVYTRENLLNNIWGEDYPGESRSVDTHIKRLRAKLNISDHFKWDIKTIWGVGYRFEVQDV
jgi:DNA-binding response OmpR family regulator